MVADTAYRACTDKEMKEQGFDVHQQVEWYENFYASGLNDLRKGLE